MAFKYEQELVNTVIGSPSFKNSIRWDAFDSEIFLELNGLFGIPDVIVVQKVNNKIIRTLAFEAKLSNWKRALAQAYRYRSFAERSFVIMDDSRIGAASNKLELFRNSNIGLLGVRDDGNVEIYYFPEKVRPFSEKMTESFVQKVT